MEPDEKQKEKNLRNMYLAYALSPLLYVVVCECILKFGFIGFQRLEHEQYSLIRFVLLLLAMVVIVLVMAAQRSIQTGALSSLSAIFLKNTMKSTADDKTMVMRATVIILSCAMAIGVFGMALFLFNGIRQDAYCFFLLSFVLMLFFIPTKEYMERLIDLRKKNNWLIK